MKKLIILGFVAFFLYACGGGDDNRTENQRDNASTENPSYDPNRGEGKYDEVDITPNLNVEMANAGQKVYDVKCGSCHKLSEERLVGPGWAGLTKRRTPVWIMNFITNPDPNIDKDPEVQAQLEICLVRMPNQNLTDDEARQTLEFMRKNDGVQP